MKNPKQIAKKLLKDKQYKHTKRVVKLCRIFADELDNVDKELLEAAAWLHDCGKAVLNKKYSNSLHSRHHLLKAVLEDYDIDDTDDVIAIISTHKGIFNPKHHVIECAVLRICDKLEKYYQVEIDDVQKVDEICKRNMREIRNVLESLNKADYEDFERIYKVVRREMKKGCAKGRKFKKIYNRIENRIMYSYWEA